MCTPSLPAGGGLSLQPNCKDGGLAGSQFLDRIAGKKMSDSSGGVAVFT